MKNAFKKAKKAVSKAGQHIRWSSSESDSSSASRHAASERMSISTEEPEEFRHHPPIGRYSSSIRSLCRVVKMRPRH
ncbi:hypothetical protein U9M48_024292 [Paspalum notatum var. saurae]|uniref:Uncharacterized protein n=1 Tax=Paspalum notatum var. saurae TaxID=547442 RepID=A0AAQ3TNC2_PASNO